MVSYSDVPRYQVLLSGGEVHGAYLTLEDAKEILRRLTAKGIVASIVERFRIW